MARALKNAAGGAAFALVLAWLALTGAAAAFPITVEDGAGRAVTIEARPERIVSVTLGSDEMVLDLVEPERVAAVTFLAADEDYSFVVEAAAAVPVHLAEANAEQIIALQPDLVFVASYTAAEVVDQLESAGLTVFRFMDFDSIDTLAEHVEIVGRLLGAEEQAKRLIDDLNARLRAVDERTAGRTLPRVLSYSLSSWVPGAGTSVGEMMERAGAVNVAAELGVQDWQPLSLEQVIASDPDVLLVAASEVGFAKRLRSDPALAGVKAVREGRVYEVPSRYLTTVSHYLVDGVEYLHYLLHPNGR